MITKAGVYLVVELLEAQRATLEPIARLTLGWGQVWRGGMPKAECVRRILMALRNDYGPNQAAYSEYINARENVIRALKRANLLDVFDLAPKQTPWTP